MLSIFLALFIVDKDIERQYTAYDVQRDIIRCQYRACQKEATHESCENRKYKRLFSSLPFVGSCALKQEVIRATMSCDGNDEATRVQI